MKTVTLLTTPFFYKIDAVVVLCDEYNYEDKLVIEATINDDIYYLEIPKKYESVLEEDDILTVSKEPMNRGHKLDLNSLKRNGVSVDFTTNSSGFSS